MTDQAHVDVLRAENQRLRERCDKLQATMDSAREHVLQIERELTARATELEEVIRHADEFKHDLQKVVYKLYYFAEMVAQDTTISAAAQEAITHLIDGIRDMESLMMRRLRRLGEFLRPLHMRMGKVSLRSIVDEVRATVSSKHPQPIEWQIGELPIVIGDELLLKELFACLLDNACRFTRDQRAARIEIVSLPAGARVLVCVRDNGAGFARGRAGALFAIGYTAHSEAEGSGAGVGLAIVRRIALRHGWTVSADGEVGKGATICLSVPHSVIVAA